MDMKKLVFLLMLLMLVTTQAYGSVMVVTPKVLSILADGNEPATAYFMVIAPNGYEKNLKIDNIPEWLDVDPVEFVINRSNTQQVKVATIPNKLKPGQYNANLRVFNVTENDTKNEAFISVVVHVMEGTAQIASVPRSIEIKPGQTKVLILSNPTGKDITISLKSSIFWIQLYPEIVSISANSSTLVWAKMTATHIPGGTYPSSIDVESELGKTEIPVKTTVVSGVEFNPDSISDSGTITMTNKMKRSVIVKAGQVEGVEFDFAKHDMKPGESKVIKVKFTGDTKPDYIGFSITGGLKPGHNVRVVK
jgi:uncharacterized cupredoxin-like copper-binding protein